jgi:hypothetical protein
MMTVDEGTKKKIGEIVARKRKQQHKQQSNYCTAATKYFANEPLTGSDMRYLLKHVDIRLDSPLKSRIGELKQQFKKQKQRLEMYCLGEVHSGENAINMKINEKKTPALNNNNNGVLFVDDQQNTSSTCTNSSVTLFGISSTSTVDPCVTVSEISIV